MKIKKLSITILAIGMLISGYGYAMRKEKDAPKDLQKWSPLQQLVFVEAQNKRFINKINLVQGTFEASNLEEIKKLKNLLVTTLAKLNYYISAIKENIIIKSELLSKKKKSLLESLNENFNVAKELAFSKIPEKMSQLEKKIQKRPIRKIEKKKKLSENLKKTFLGTLNKIKKLRESIPQISKQIIEYKKDFNFDQAIPIFVNFIKKLKEIDSRNILPKQISTVMEHKEDFDTLSYSIIDNSVWVSNILFLNPIKPIFDKIDQLLEGLQIGLKKRLSEN